MLRARITHWQRMATGGNPHSSTYAFDRCFSRTTRRRGSFVRPGSFLTRASSVRGTRERGEQSFIDSINSHQVDLVWIVRSPRYLLTGFYRLYVVTSIVVSLPISPPPLPLPFVILFVKESVAMRHLSLDDLPSTLIRSRNKNLIALNRSYSTEWRFEVKIDFLKVIVIYTILSTKSSGPFLNYLQSIILKKRREKKRKEKTLQLPKTLIQGHFFQPVQFYERSRCTIIHHCLRSLIIQHGVIVQPCNQTA